VKRPRSDSDDVPFDFGPKASPPTAPTTPTDVAKGGDKLSRYFGAKLVYPQTPDSACRTVSADSTPPFQRRDAHQDFIDILWAANR